MLDISKPLSQYVCFFVSLLKVVNKFILYFVKDYWLIIEACALNGVLNSCTHDIICRVFIVLQSKSTLRLHENWASPAPTY